MKTAFMSNWTMARRTIRVRTTECLYGVQCGLAVLSALILSGMAIYTALQTDSDWDLFVRWSLLTGAMLAAFEFLLYIALRGMTYDLKEQAIELRKHGRLRKSWPFEEYGFLSDGMRIYVAKKPGGRTRPLYWLPRGCRAFKVIERWLQRRGRI